MEMLKDLVSSLCVSLILFGVLMILVPEGNMKKSFKTLVGIAIIATFLLTVGSIKKTDEKFNFRLKDTQTSYDLSSTVTQNERSYIEYAVKNLLENKLKENNIFNFSVYISTDILDNGNIFISDVKVVCPENDISKAESIVLELGLPVNVKGK